MNKLFAMLSVVAVAVTVIVLGGCGTTREVYLVDGREFSVEEFKAYRLEHPHIATPVVVVERPASPVYNPPSYRWNDGSVHDVPEVSLADEMAKMKDRDLNGPGVDSFAETVVVQSNDGTPAGELTYIGTSSSSIPPAGIGSGFKYVIVVPRGTPVVRDVRFCDPRRPHLLSGVVGVGEYHFYGTNHDYWGPDWGGGYSYSSQAHFGFGGGFSVESGLNNSYYRSKTFSWSYRQEDNRCNGRNFGGNLRGGGRSGPSNSGMRHYGPIYRP